MKDTYGRAHLKQIIFEKIFHIIKESLQPDANMLYYVKISNFEGLDYSEGQDCTRDTKLESGQCSFCIFYFYHKLNFHYERYICNGCYHCLQYETANTKVLFRVITTKRELLELLAIISLLKLKNYLKNWTLTTDLDGYTKIFQRQKMNIIKTWKIFAEKNEVKVGSSCRIEPQSLK